MNGVLDTCPIQRFPLDLRRIDRFHAHDRNAQAAPVFIENMTGRTDQDAGLFEKMGLARGEFLPVQDEVRPVATFPSMIENTPFFDHNMWEK